MEITLNRQALFRRQIALPQDHGSWVFLISPLLIGLFAGGAFTTASAFLVLAAMSAFLVRQPVTMAVKAVSGRRSRKDLFPALAWACLYALLGLFAFASLAVLGYGYLGLLALPGLPVFVLHLVLVSRRSERRQMGVELVGCGVLALAAPAAFWVARGWADPNGWWLFLLTWFQSAASIVYAYLRLAQRVLPGIPDRSTQFKMARRALAYTSFNLLAVLVLSLLKFLPVFLPVPFAIQWAESIWGAFHPAVGWKPTRIGVRQLIVSSLFTLFFIQAW